MNEELLKQHLAHHTDGPATIPGYRAKLAIEMGIDPNSDLTDIELDAQYLAASTFTRLELEQLNQKP